MKKTILLVTALILIFSLCGINESYAVNAQQAYIEITWAQEAIADKESQGYDVSKAKKILEEARQAYRLDKYRKAAELAGKVRKMFVKEAMREAGIKKSVLGPLDKALGYYGLPTPGIPIKRQFAIAPKPEPAGAPKSKLSGDDEYYILYATFKSWGMDFNELYDTYSKKALTEDWTAFWIGSTENTAQRVYFDRVGDKWKPRMSDLATPEATPISVSEIPPKPDGLLPSDAEVATYPITELGTKYKKIAVICKGAPDNPGSGFIVDDLLRKGLTERGYTVIDREAVSGEIKRVIEEQKAKGFATDGEKTILSITKDDLVTQGAAPETAGMISATIQGAVKQKRDIREETVDPAQIGKALGADAVVTGHLFHYGDITRRAGIMTLAAGFTSLAGEGVDLEIKIIDTATGSIIWRDRYTYTPTAEQAFTGFGKAGKAESIAQEVVNALLDKIPERKEETQ